MIFSLQNLRTIRAETTSLTVFTDGSTTIKTVCYVIFWNVFAAVRALLHVDNLWWEEVLLEL
jgi:hypothetical protein